MPLDHAKYALSLCPRKRRERVVLYNDGAHTRSVTKSSLTWRAHTCGMHIACIENASRYPYINTSAHSYTQKVTRSKQVRFAETQEMSTTPGVWSLHTLSYLYVGLIKCEGENVYSITNLCVGVATGEFFWWETHRFRCDRSITCVGHKRDMLCWPHFWGAIEMYIQFLDGVRKQWIV